jgi:hypothetical protein
MPRKAPDAVPAAPFEWRDRILRLEYVSPRDLDDHPLQHKIHPESQAEVMRGVLEDVGIADVLRAYISPSSGKLTAIDGHLRKSLGAQPWPTLILDVSDEEAAYLLSLYDEIAGLAIRDKERLNTLLHEVQSGNSAVQQLLSEIAQNHGLYADAPPTLDDLDQAYGAPDDQAFWKTISLKVPPEVYDQYIELLGLQEGDDDASRFAALLDQVAS